MDLKETIVRDIDIPVSLIPPDDLEGERTVFLSPDHQLKKNNDGFDHVLGAKYVFEDSLLNIGGIKKHNEAIIYANEESSGKRNPRFLQAYIRYVLDKLNLKLVHVAIGINKLSRNPYITYGYIVPEEEEN